MSDSSWVLKDVDLEVREKAVAEAARLGVPVADYLTDMLLRSALLDQVNALAEGETASSAADDAKIFAPSPESPEGFAVRERLKSLERRLGATTGSLEGAIHAVDSSLFDVTARLGEVEALAGDTAKALSQNQQDVDNTTASLQLHIAVVEDNLSALGRFEDERASGLSDRINQVEGLAHGAQQSATVLAEAHEALKHALAEDFADFANETADRLTEGLLDVSKAADIAAQQADAAVAHLITELRSVREALDDQVAGSVAQTRAHVRAAFTDTSDRIAALTQRVSENERAAARTADQLQNHIAGVEDGAQMAIEEAAEAMRQGDSALAADIAIVAHDSRAALDATRQALTAEIVSVREDQFSQLARLKLVDAAVGNTINEIAALREGIETRLRDALEELQANAAARDEALDVRATDIEHETAHLRQTLIVEVERVEASTLVALQKLARDIADGDAAAGKRLEAATQGFRTDVNQLRQRTDESVKALREEHASASARLDAATQGFRTDLGQIRQQGDANLKALREEHSGAVARIGLLDGAVARIEGAVGPIEGRLARIEAVIDPSLSARVAQLEVAANNAETAQALAIVRAQVETLAARVSDKSGETALGARISELQRRLEVYDAAADSVSDQLQGLARTLNRVAAQSLESAEKAEARAHQVELAVADLRLNQIAASESTTAVDAANGVRALEARLNAMDQRQSDLLHTLRDDIARFVTDNDRRLDALEQASATSGAALPSNDDLIARFEELRERIEDRVLGVEVRSVRTLEQVIDTVASIDQRLFQSEQDAEAKTA